MGGHKIPTEVSKGLMIYFLNYVMGRNEASADLLSAVKSFAIAHYDKIDINLQECQLPNHQSNRPNFSHDYDINRLLNQPNLTIHQPKRKYFHLTA